MPPQAPRSVPRSPGTIEEQISSAIASGFSTVLTDMKAQNAEMLSALKEISRVGRTSAARTMRPEGAVEMAQKAEKGAAELTERLSAPEGVHQPAIPAWMSGHRKHGGATREDLRERLADSFARRAEEWTLGAFENAATTGAERRLREGVTMDDSGRYRKNGKFIKPEAAYETISREQVLMEGATPDESASYLRRGIMANRAVDVARAWAGGEPFGRALANALPKKALAAAGTAATAVAVANEGWEKIQGQYAENRKYQQYYGGSNLDQLGERADRWLNKNIRGRFSLLGPEAYDELWTQAMDMGMRGHHRSDYINIGADMMGRGVSGQETEALLSMAIESGGATRSMRELVDAISSVGAVAREAGVSAKEARKIFIENYKASTSGILGDSGTAIQQAQAFTMSQVGMGHAYMGRVDYSGTLSRGNQYANARMLGLSPSEYYVMQQTTSTLPGMAMNEDRIRQQLNQLPNSSGKTMQQVVYDFMASLGREFRAEAGDLVQLSLAIEMAGFNRDQIAAILNRNGMRVDPASAPGVAGNLFTSNAPSQIASREQESMTAKLMGPADLGGIKLGGVIAGQTNSISSALNVQTHWNEALKDIYTTASGSGNRAWSRLPGSVELELLRNVGTYKLDPDTSVMVKAGGKDRAVSLEEALKLFPDQISNGSVVILEGEHQGKKLSDVMGFTGTEVAKRNAPSASSGENAGVGEDIDSFFASMSKDSGSSNAPESVQVSFDLKPRVAEILDMYVNGEYYASGPTG